MKSPAEFIIGILFTLFGSGAIFWYGSYALIYIQAAFIRYWWAFAACGITFMLGRIS